MENTIKRTNKATLIAATLIITASTAVFGTFANEEVVPTDQSHRPFAHQELTEEQKEVLKEAKELFEAGNKDEAKAMLEEAGIKRPKGHARRAKFIESLTDEQKAALEEAKELRQSGDKEGARAIMEAAGIERPGKGKRFGKRCQHNQE